LNEIWISSEVVELELVALVALLEPDDSSYYSDVSDVELVELVELEVPDDSISPSSEK